MIVNRAPQFNEIRHCRGFLLIASAKCGWVPGISQNERQRALDNGSMKPYGYIL
jgi:hypothetical protein